MNFSKTKFGLPALLKQLIVRNFHHFLTIYSFSLLIIVLFVLRYDKIVIVLTIVLFNLNALIHSKLWKNIGHQPEREDSLEKQLHNQVANFEWLQKIVDQLWTGDLVVLFQKELNKFYTKNRSTEFNFYHFYLNENQPPKIDQMYMPLESMRKDEIVIHLRTTINGTVLFKLNEENDQDKTETAFTSLLVKKYGFRKKYQIGQYQDANLKKKNFLTKEFYLNGRSRIILRPLTDWFPYFTSLNFTLLDYPLLYSNDVHDVCESSNEFERNFYNYLIERICLPFLHPNRLIILYAHQDHIKYEHSLLFKQKLSETNQFMQMKLRRLFKNKRKVNDFIHELNDQKIINWYKTNIIENLDLIELNLNSSTFHPFPLFISRIKLIELENLVTSNCFLFIRIRIGQLSVSKTKLITSKSPVLNLTHLLPVHDYYEKCSIQILQIRSSNPKTIKKCTAKLDTLFWSQKMNKLPKNDRLIRPIGELTFPLDRRTFDYDDMNYSLNGQDFWLPLDGPKQSMIHLSCSCFKLSSAFRTIRKLSRITRAMMIKKNDLNSNLLPVAFIKIYVENFICTYKKDNKLKSRRNQFSQIEFSFYKQKKTIDLMKLTKTRLIFRDSCHFFVYDDPFSFDLLVELLDKNKSNFGLENQENKMRLLNLIHLEEYKKNKSNLYHNEKLPIYIVNNKDFIATKNNKQKKNANFKFIDKEEFGKLTLNLFIKYVHLDNNILEKLLLAPEIRGYNVEKRAIKKSFESTKKDRSQFEELVTNIDKKKKFEADECVGKLYFKLVSDSCLEVGVLNVTNVPYDKIKRVKLQVIIELWKGNFKVAAKKTPFTDIVHNPTFETSFNFNIDSCNLQQFAIRFVVIQKSGFFRSILTMIADRFCTIPRLTKDIDLKIRSYILKTDKKGATNSANKNTFNLNA